jgi:CMP-N-acetylneuraminic acid synthetase
MVTEASPVPVLLIGRGGSRGVPGKNTMPILGRPLMTYPLMAAFHSRHAGPIFLATDAAQIRAIGREHGVELIDLAPDMTRDSVLVESVVVHCHREIRRRLGSFDIFVLLFCNSATLSPQLIDAGIEALRADPSLDSAVSVSPYNEYSPVRAKRITDEGLLAPYVDIDAIDGASCDRDSATTCYFCDCSVWVLRERCTQLERGVLPFRWMGQRTMPLYQHGGLDIDHDYGIPMTECWLRQHGFTETSTPYEAYEGRHPRLLERR